MSKTRGISPDSHGEGKTARISRSTRKICVHLLPAAVTPEDMAGGLVVVIDVLRATTTMVTAFAAGAKEIYPALTVDEARLLAAQLNQSEAGEEQPCILTGERKGVLIPGFNCGNSPSEFTPEVCYGRRLVCTTTNGTVAMHHARLAARMLIGAFVNFSAICEELRTSDLPIHLLCAGTDGGVALEDVMFAGAVVDFLVHRGPSDLDDGARIAWDTYEQHGKVLVSALELSGNGRHLLDLGLDGDIKDAAAVDRYGLIPEVTGDPLCITPGILHLGEDYFLGETGLVDD